MPVSEAKIDHIDNSLAQLSRLVEQLRPSSSCRSSHLLEQAGAAGVSSGRDAGPVIDRNTRSSNGRAVDRSKEIEIAQNEALVEGQSSLTAHSEFAIGVLHNNVVGCHGGVGDGSEIIGLLDTLRDMVDTFHRQRLSPKPLFPLANAVSAGDRNGCPMPPLESVFEIIHNAQGTLSRSCLALLEEISRESR